MSQIDPDTGTMFASMDWKHYIDSRPSYPPSLKDIILSYHSAKPSPQYNQLIDLGGGVGIAATMFADKFQTVHLVDPSPDNITKAQSFLREWNEHEHVHPTLQFTQATAENAPDSVSAGAADLLICATAAHFIDPDVLVASAAHMLRAGGTLAIYSYLIPSFASQSQRFNDTFGGTLGAMVGLGLNEESTPFMSKIRARTTTGRGVLASVPLPEEYYEDTQRVYINPEGWEASKRMTHHLPVPDEPIEPRETERETGFDYVSGRDPQASGWTFDTGHQWLTNFMHSMTPEKVDLTSERYVKVFSEWDRVFKEECPSGSVQVTFTVNLLLARRK